jgi:hypothetical protein
LDRPDSADGAALRAAAVSDSLEIGRVRLLAGLKADHRRRLAMALGRDEIHPYGIAT